MGGIPFTNKARRLGVAYAFISEKPMEYSSNMDSVLLLSITNAGGMNLAGISSVPISSKRDELGIGAAF
jgi:membrane protease subunit (stomatin/prohibitin family)